MPKRWLLAVMLTAMTLAAVAVLRGRSIKQNRPLSAAATHAVAPAPPRPLIALPSNALQSPDPPPPEAIRASAHGAEAAAQAAAKIAAQH